MRRAARRTILRGIYRTSTTHISALTTGVRTANSTLPSAGSRSIARKLLFAKLLQLEHQQWGSSPADDSVRSLHNPAPSLPRAQRNLALRASNSVVAYRSAARTPSLTTFDPSSRLISRADVTASDLETALSEERFAGQLFLARRSFFGAPQRLHVGSSSHPSLRRRRGSAALYARQKRRVELHSYHKYPRLRLARTAVTRRRRRRGGLGLFARYTLKRPQTREGFKNLLLPPRGVYYRHTHSTKVGAAAIRSSLYPRKMFDSANPRVWAKPPRKRSWRLAYVFKLRRRVTRRYFSKLLARKRRQRWPLPSVSSLSQKASTTKLDPFLTVVASQNYENIAPGFAAGLARGLLPLTDAPATVSTLSQQLSMRKTSYYTLSKLRSTTARRRQNSLWHSRSVRAMQRAERAFSA